MNAPDPVKVPELSLPKGGGAIHGLNETVQSVGMTGMASLSLPLPVSAGRGFTPSLALSYSSGSGNGPFGIGWSVGLPAISRRLTHGVPAYTPEDVFIGPDGEALVPEWDAEKKVKTDLINQYRDTSLDEYYQVVRFFPRIEGNFDRIERWTPVDAAQSKPCFWLVHGADGSVHLYGKTEAGRIADPASPNIRIARWLLEASFSPTGEHIHYVYRSENTEGLTEADTLRDHTANRYLERVCYGNKVWSPSFYLLDAHSVPDQNWHFEVVFDYGEAPQSADKPPTFKTTKPWARRQDAFSDYANGFEVRTHRLCRQVCLFHAFDALGEAPVLVRRMVLGYDETPFVSILKEVTHFGAEQNAKSRDRIPPIFFKHEAFEERKASFDPSHFRLLPTLTGIDDGKRYQFIDLYGEGVPGVLYQEESGWRYRAPQRDAVLAAQGKPDAVTYGPWHPLPSAPLGHSHANAPHALIDLTGNGQLDWVITYPGLAGFFTQHPDQTWSNFTPFTAFPSEFLHPHAHLANVMGAGLSDLVLIGPKSVRLYANQREHGFAPSLEVPHTRDDALPLAGISKQEVVAFSDVLGSGQAHLVRVRHDHMMCWPNLGRGRFGTPLRWDIALPVKNAQFNPDAVFLADLDGSGAADLMYVQSDGVWIYRNQSGNGFDTPEILRFPEGLRYDTFCNLNFADIDGLGCASLILTVPHPHPQHWRYDFSQGRKPYLLTSINNNIGLQVHFTYRSSAQEWLDEKAEHEHTSTTGQPAASHLPFPVHVVHKITHLDEITGNTLTQQFTYRHGYYDGQEREFRGFGLVTHTDTELFSDAGVQDKDTGKHDTYTAPVKTKTWYHRGMEQDAQARFAYSQHDPQAISLESTVFTCFDPTAGEENILTADKLDASKRKEMVRALKGSVLREEVFGLDNPAAGPYVTSESRYLVRCIQDGGPDHYAVVVPFSLESLRYHYERTPTDPVCTQHINIAWDQYGSLTRSVTVHYPRREGTSPFEEEGKTPWWEASYALQKSCWEASKDDAQKVMWLTETRHAWHHLDTPQAWRLALPYQTRTEAYEIGPDNIPQSVHYESLHDLDLPTFGASKTLLGHQVYRYVTEPGVNHLPVTLEGLLKHIETVEFNTQTLRVYDDLPELIGEDKEKALEAAGYIKLLDPLWSSSETLWTRIQGMCTYAPPETFRRLVRHQFAVGTGPTLFTYDPYACLLTCIEDAMGNQFKSHYDYRYLLPIRLVDPNQNVQEAYYDALGRLIASSFYGMEDGRFQGFDILKDYQRPILELGKALENPNEAIGQVAAVYYYDALSWMEKRGPVQSAVLASDRYPIHSKAQVRITLSGSDGFGRVLQAKQKVEAGISYHRDEMGNLALNNGKPIEIKAATRWVVSGRVEYNNKGLPIRSYQPYCIDSYLYVNDAACRLFGYCDTHYYDPLGREVGVVTAENYLRRQTYHTWCGIKEDENDTLAERIADGKWVGPAYEPLALEGEVNHVV